ncbi:MAG TPA: GAF domain-containing protein [Kofleriaceae bacterium]|nr:GAF domain-containing protein [Kofleriaceae bacterium]
MVARFTRLPADFVDRLRDLLCTIQSEQIMMRAEAAGDRLRRIVALAVKQTGAELGLLYLVHDERGDLEIAAAVGDPVESLVGSHLPRTGTAGFAIDDASPMAIADPPGATAAPDELDRRAAISTRNALAVPLIVHAAAAGAIELRNSPAARGFGPDDVALATELAYLAAAAVEEHRGDRFLVSLFAAALPRALADGRSELAQELERWLAELRQTPAWRDQLELVTDVRELCLAGDTELARQVLRALVASERRRRRVTEL